MNEEFFSDEFKNMVAEKAFDGETITVIFHNGNPGPTGIAFTFGDTRGILNLRPDRWELGGVGIVQNAFDENVGVLSETANSTVRYYSLWRGDGSFLGYRKFLRDIIIPTNDSLRLSARTIRYKFF